MRKPTFKNTGWWEIFVPEMTADVFKENFRVDRPTFDYIVDKVRERMSPQFGNNGRFITVDKKVAIALKV
jgi:hypothetical protein